MFRCPTLGLAGVVSIVVCVHPEVTHAGTIACIDRVIVRPVGRITNADPVRLEVEVHTSSAPAFHTQPTEVSIVGDSVAVRIHVEGGPLDTFDSITEVIELGVLDPRTYRYAIALNPTTDPPANTADGTFCVEDSGCADAACRCPVFTPQYTIISLGTLGGYSSWGQAINDLGQVAGRSVGPNGQHAFLWQNGTMTDLGTFSPGDIESSGLGINNHGDVVGYSGPGRAVLWRDGQIIDLGTLGFDSIAYGINDAGQVAGMSQVAAYEYHPFLWQNGELIDLTTTFGAPMGRAEDINALGQIVIGNIILELGGAITELGTLGGAYSAAVAINDQGQVVGKSQRGDGSKYDLHAFIWDGEVMTDVGAIGRYEYSEAVDINNSGQVIGWGDGPDPWCGGFFLYESAKGLRKLRDLIPVDSGWTSLQPYPALWAYGINNTGQIAGTGGFQGETRAFLMTPISTTPGACCAADGACTTTLLTECRWPLWVEGTVCSPNRCPLPPIVAALGSRYLSVALQSWEPDETVAIRISSPRFPCLPKYVALDSGMGRFIDNPVFLSASEWGTVYVADTGIVPSTMYEVQIQNALGLSQPASVTTPIWCDVADRFGIVNVLDIVGFVNRLKSLPSSPPLEACDVYPAVPDQIVNALDIVLAVDAVKERPYPFPLPCD